MAATFPGGIWGPATLVDGVDEILAAHQNDPNLEIVAIETVLQAYAGVVGRYMQAWVAHDSTNPTIGVIPSSCMITRITVYVTEAFDDSGTDKLEIGFEANHDAFVDDLPIDEVGQNECHDLRAMTGPTVAEYTVKAWYTGENADATAGKALIIIEYKMVDAEPL